LIGLALGVYLDRFINQDRFRQLVQFLLIFLGIGLIL
jgi:ABC-type phosphate transport system permease subunit